MVVSLSINIEFLFQVQTDFEALTPTSFVINVPSAETINHVVVFLTGTTPFPVEMGGLGNILNSQL